MQDLAAMSGDLRALCSKISVLRIKSRLEARPPHSRSAADVDVVGPLKAYIEHAAAGFFPPVSCQGGPLLATAA
jgi:hypothetical protein